MISDPIDAVCGDSWTTTTRPSSQGISPSFDVERRDGSRVDHFDRRPSTAAVSAARSAVFIDAP